MRVLSRIGIELTLFCARAADKDDNAMITNNKISFLFLIFADNSWEFHWTILLFFSSFTLKRNRWLNAVLSATHIYIKLKNESILPRLLSE